MKTKAYDSLLDDYAAGLIQWVSWCPTSKRIYVHTFRLDTDYRVAEPVDLALLQRDFSRPADVPRTFVPGIARERSYDAPPTPSSAAAPPGGQLP